MVVPPRRSPSRPTTDNPPSAEREVVDLAGFGAMLRSRREEAGLSVRQAAEDAGVSFSTITRVESGSQPDLATFLKLCGWLRVRPERFFVSGGRREESTVEAVVHHLYADPALESGAAEKIASVVRDLYSALASPPVSRPTVACHLRAAPILRAGVAERLNGILGDLHEVVERQVRSGAL